MERMQTEDMGRRINSAKGCWSLVKEVGLKGRGVVSQLQFESEYSNALTPRQVGPIV